MSNRRKLRRDQRRARRTFVDDQLAALADDAAKVVQRHRARIGGDHARDGRHPLALVLGEDMERRLKTGEIGLCRHAEPAPPSRLFWAPDLHFVGCRACVQEFVASAPDDPLECHTCGRVAPLRPFSFAVGPVIVLAALCDDCIDGPPAHPAAPVGGDAA